MTALLRNRLSAWLSLLAGSWTVPAATLHWLLGEGDAPVSGAWHAAVMAGGASVALAAALGLVFAGGRRHDGRAVVVGGAFAVMGSLLVAHGLATPGVFTGPNGLVAVAGGTALPAGGFLLALATLEAVQRPTRIRLLVGAQLGLIVVIGSALGIALWRPAAVPSVPAAGTPAALALLACGIACFAVLTWRASRTYALTRRRADLVVVVGAAWMAFALVPSLTLAPGGWAWWLGHVLEFVGVALVGIPTALDLWRTVPSRPLAGDLAAAELVRDEEIFLGDRVRRLLADLGRKDSSTEDHTRRVALLAVQVGDALGLAPGRLRELAVGGLLHDMGKLSVPDRILRKPGRLTDDEMDVVRMHPTWGAELLAALGFSTRIRQMVAGHHERMDGGGYPAGVPAAELGLETRILTVCDVYDALVSPRVYRDAWPPERALALLRDETGSAFDGRCVAALERVLRASPQQLPAPATA